MKADKVTFKDTKTLAWINGPFEKVEKTVVLPNNILVKTNGVYTIKGRSEHQLKEGDIIDKEGMLTTKGGKVMSLLDHITQDRNQVKIIIDAQEKPLTQPFKLPGGMTVLPSGWIERPGKSKVRLFDGQILRLDGKIQTARDSITMKDGKVFVQKEGAQFEILPGRSIVMNDGTKVYGSGRVEYRDGRKVQLKNDEILYVEGAKRNIF